MSNDAKTSSGVRKSEGWIGVVFKVAHLRRTGTTALLVGTWLTVMNHIDVMLGAGWDWALSAKVLLNYLTPFVVANIGLLSRQGRD